MPAARVTDMHVCPMVTGIVPHVGGPIIPPCAITVLTGSLPQARISDMLVCVGPPDMIAMGAFTVIVSGMPAARIGDMTVHGGVIVMGLPTVLIGDNGAGGGGGGGGGATVGVGGPKAGMAGSFTTLTTDIAKMEQGAYANLPAPPPAVPSASRPECAEVGEALVDGALAAASYGDAAIPPGYRPVTDRAALDALGLTPEMLTPPLDEESGFAAQVYAYTLANGVEAYVVAFRGTRASELNDWIANGRQAVGLASDHYDRAKEIATNIAQQADNVRFAGHSLGGGLASAAAAVTGKLARTYNAAGLSERTVAEVAGMAAPVIAYFTKNDPLSALQDNREIVLGALTQLASLLNVGAGALIAGYILGREIGDSPLLPKAFGERRELPSPAEYDFIDRANPLKQHSMDAVLASLAQQQCDLGC